MLSTSLRGTDIRLHDATLATISLAWEARTCVMQLSLSGSDYGRRVALTWHGVTQFSMSSERAWGPSAAVYEVRSLADGIDEIAMQSGDVIRIQADSVTLQDVSGAASIRA